MECIDPNPDPFYHTSRLQLDVGSSVGQERHHYDISMTLRFPSFKETCNQSGQKSPVVLNELKSSLELHFDF